MPFPILHTYAGYAVYKLSENKQKPFQWAVAFWAIVLANLADFDFIPGVLLKDAARFHRLASHSFVAAILCGIFCGVLAVLWKKSSFLRTFTIAASAYASHLFLDLYSGSMALMWPFSDRIYGLNNYVTTSGNPFLDATTIPGFIAGMLTTGCLVRMIRELMVVLFCFLLTYITRSVLTQMPVRVRFIHNTTFGISLLYISIYLLGNL